MIVLEPIMRACSGALEDTMESFFLSETVKYLYLLWSDAAALPDFYLLSTEGHLVPPIHLSTHSAVLGSSLLSGIDCSPLSTSRTEGDLRPGMIAAACM